MIHEVTEVCRWELYPFYMRTVRGLNFIGYGKTDMNCFFSTVWSDLEQRKNLELNLILLIAVVILFADVFDVETISGIILP